MIFGIKHSVTGTSPEISDVSVAAAARGSNLDGCIPYHLLDNDSRSTRLKGWTACRIAQLLPAMERFIPEFILARGAM
jgi:hypothetical protein